MVTTLARCNRCGHVRKLIAYAGARICARCLVIMDAMAKWKPDPTPKGKQKPMDTREVRAKRGAGW